MYQRYASRIAVIATLILVAFYSASAQKRKIPSVENMLNTGSQGTEFWIAIPPNEINPYPVDELEIYVASAFDTDIEVFDAAGDKKYRRTLKSYEVRTLSDSKGETNWTWELREPEQVVRKGVRITSKKPISVYVLNSNQPRPMVTWPSLSTAGARNTSVHRTMISVSMITGQVAL